MWLPDWNVRKRRYLKMSEDLERAKEDYKLLQEEKKKDDIKKITEAYFKSKRKLCSKRI